MHVAGIGGSHADVEAANKFYAESGLDPVEGLTPHAFADFMLMISEKFGQSIDDLANSFNKALGTTDEE